MATKKQSLLEKINNAKSIVTTVLAVSTAIVVGAWKMYAEPEIDKRVKKEVKPINYHIKELIKGQEYHTYLFMSTLTDEQIEWATNRYTTALRSKGQISQEK